MEPKTLNFPSNLARALEEKADELGVSQGEIARSALRRELEV